ncbi:hypothetical protein Hanom_Chr09g00859701 [Helianthus anomalus]
MKRDGYTVRAHPEEESIVVVNFGIIKCMKRGLRGNGGDDWRRPIGILLHRWDNCN